VACGLPLGGPDPTTPGGMLPLPQLKALACWLGAMHLGVGGTKSESKLQNNPTQCYATQGSGSPRPGRHGKGNHILAQWNPQSALKAPQTSWLLVTQSRAQTGDDTCVTFKERQGFGRAGLWAMLVLIENYIRDFEVVVRLRKPSHSRQPQQQSPWALPPSDDA
jgi:hypothetical protein